MWFITSTVISPKGYRDAGFHYAFNWVVVVSYSEITLPTVQIVTVYPHEGRLAALTIVETQNSTQIHHSTCMEIVQWRNNPVHAVFLKVILVLIPTAFSGRTFVQPIYIVASIFDLICSV